MRGIVAPESLIKRIGLTPTSRTRLMGSRAVGWASAHHPAGGGRNELKPTQQPPPNNDPVTVYGEFLAY